MSILRQNLLVFLFAIFFVSISGFALCTSTEDDSWHRARFVHLTSYVRNGTVRPGNIMMFRNNHPVTGEDAASLIKETANRGFHTLLQKQGSETYFIDLMHRSPQKRITSHWCLDGPIDDIDSQDLPPGTVGYWSEKQIAVVELAQHFKGELYGGLSQDFIVVGPHVLSKDSWIIAPQSEIESLNESNLDFPGKFFTYNSLRYDIRQAIKLFYQQKKINKTSWSPPTAQPTTTSSETYLQYLRANKSKLSQKNKQALQAIENFLKKNDGDVSKLQISVPKQRFSEVAKRDKLNWIAHDNTVFWEIEVLLTEIFKPIYDFVYMGEYYGLSWKEFTETTQGPPHWNFDDATISQLKAKIEALNREVSFLSPETKKYVNLWSKGINAWLKFLNSVKELNSSPNTKTKDGWTNQFNNLLAQARTTVSIYRFSNLIISKQYLA